jgi:hypothetical protein
MMARRVLVIVLQALLAIVLAASLYLFAATASISETYQPGISMFRLRLHPMLTVLVFAGCPLAAGLLGSAGWRVAAYVGARLAVTAVVISAAFVAALATAQIAGVHCTTPPPAERDLDATLRHALRCPEFSNRSYTTPLVTGLASLALVLVARRARPDAP